MDKRKYLGQRDYLRADGTSFKANIYRKSTNMGMTIRIVYGQVEVYVSTNSTIPQIDKFVNTIVNKYPNKIIDRPFMSENEYFWVLGQKKYLTRNPSLANIDSLFYVSKKVKDPLTAYKKEFLDYVTSRTLEIAKNMNLDLSGWEIRTGLFISLYGVCFTVKHILKFDFRLFAFKGEVSDAIIYHELSHIFDAHHDARFYVIVKTYCPNYDELMDDIDCSRYEGRLDKYGI
ncbi:MAG: YgjP-like metallopeptidase domain-containing protein [Bacilli bacterium]